MQDCPSTLHVAVATSAKLDGQTGVFVVDAAPEFDVELHAITAATETTPTANRKLARVGPTSIPDLYQHLRSVRTTW